MPTLKQFVDVLSLLGICTAAELGLNFAAHIFHSLPEIRCPGTWSHCREGLLNIQNRWTAQRDVLPEAGCK